MTEMDQSAMPASELQFRAFRAAKTPGGSPHIVMLGRPELIKMKVFTNYKLQKRDEEGNWNDYTYPPPTPEENEGDGGGGEG
jgi:hypothetical protein